jgi:hypothetical protein
LGVTSDDVYDGAEPAADRLFQKLQASLREGDDESTGQQMAEAIEEAMAVAMLRGFASGLYFARRNAA